MLPNAMQAQLSEYYAAQAIHPQDFRCVHQEFCRRYAYQGVMTPVKMSMVGSQYGVQYPHIVVVSLDPPNGGDSTSDQRTTAYLSSTHEADNYTTQRTNVHWAMTQIIVKDILALYGYQAQAGAAVVDEPYGGRPIENVCAYFAHVNAAKCSMNNPGKGQAAGQVHQRCSGSYLLGELTVLQPDILITQGSGANAAVGALFPAQAPKRCQPPDAHRMPMGETETLWLLMPHPAYRGLTLIRQAWPFYIQHLATRSGN